MKGNYSVYNLKKRLFSFVIAIAVIFACLFGKLFHIQIIQGEKLQIKASEQWTRDLPVTASRGLIVDANGVVLAANNTTYTVYARPREIADVSALAARLASVLEIDGKELFEKLGKSVSEITVYKKATRQQFEAVTALNEKGIYISPDIERVYPYGELMSQVLGYISVDSSGQSGLEKYYDKFLKGIEGYVLSESDLTGNKLDGSTAYYIPPISGLNLKLTVDYTIQSITENVMERAMLAHQPVGARAIVMDPQTGAILAMVNKPGFDLNAPPRDDIDLLNKNSRNSLVVDIYEPGSTFKIFTTAANIQEYNKGNKNAFSLSHIFPNGRTRVVDGRLIKCWDGHKNGKHTNQNLSMALNHSCNPIFVDIALSLGKDVFYNYMDAFGFGKATGIDFLGEGSGMVIPEQSARAGDLARMGFGHSIAISPLQLAAATAAAVNGGKYMQPYLVSEIYSDDGLVAEKMYPTMLRQSIDEKSSRQVAALLEEVVNDGGGRNAYINGYKVGGKTGTAQKFENGQIAQGKYVSSFVGFFPADNPQYLALVIIDEPVGASYGSIVAAPYAKTIFEQIIYYKSLKPFGPLE